LFLKTYPNNIFTKEKYWKEVPSIKPVDFIKKAKLNYAAKLLVIVNGHTINEVSWRSGFNVILLRSSQFVRSGKLVLTL